MSTNQEDTLRQFRDVTGADEARSKFFLESSDWLLEVALCRFYEHGGNADQMESGSDIDSPPASPPRAPVPRAGSARQNFATLSSLQREGSSDEEEGQAFYAGGSDRSGQQIIGPGKNKKDIVTEMFKSARERGAIVFEDEQSSSSRGGGAFSGVGYRLGQTPEDHAPVNTPPAQGSNQDVRAVRLRLYREGFTIDDGAIRLYSDPNNAEFLSCIRRGEIPTELSNTHGGAEVRVSLEDRRLEECPKKNASAKAFTGKGQMLGSPAPVTVGATTRSEPRDREADMRAAELLLKVDETKPVTTLQIRLADGSRISGRFNHSHTISDVRQFIVTAAPNYQLQSFVLMTAFPSAQLDDNNKTIAEENLLNSVIVQRLK